MEKTCFFFFFLQPRFRDEQQPNTMMLTGLRSMATTLSGWERPHVPSQSQKAITQSKGRTHNTTEHNTRDCGRALETSKLVF